MKKIFRYAVVMLIMATFVLGTGCINNDNISQANSDLSSNINTQTNNDLQEKLDFAWEVINDSKEPYSVLERYITSMEFEDLSTTGQFALIEDKIDTYYGGYHYMKFKIRNSKIDNVENGIHIYLSDSDLFFIKDDEIAENYYYCIYQVLKDTPEIYSSKDIAHIVLLSPTDYEYVVSTFRNNL